MTDASLYTALRTKIAEQAARPAFYRRVLTWIFVVTDVLMVGWVAGVMWTSGNPGDVVGPLTLIVGIAALVMAVFAVVAGIAAYELSTQGPSLEISTWSSNQPKDLVVVPVQYVEQDAGTDRSNHWTVAECRSGDATIPSIVVLHIANAGLRTAKNTAVRLEFSGCQLARTPDGFSVLSRTGLGASSMSFQSSRLAQIHPGWELLPPIEVDLTDAFGRGGLGRRYDMAPGWQVRIEVVADDTVSIVKTIPIMLAAYWKEYADASEREAQSLELDAQEMDTVGKRVARIPETVRRIHEATKDMSEGARAVFNDDYSSGVPDLPWLREPPSSTIQMLEDLQHGRAIPLDASPDQIQHLIDYRSRSEEEYRQWRAATHPTATLSGSAQVPQPDAKPSANRSNERAEPDAPLVGPSEDVEGPTA